MSRHHRELGGIVRAGGVTLLRQGAGLVLALISSVLLARLLGRTGVGVIALAMLLPNLLRALLNFGFPAATVYFLGRGDYPLRQLFAANLLLSVGISLVGGAIGVGVVFGIHEQLFPGVPPDCLLLALPILPLALLVSLPQSCLQALHRFGSYNLLSLAIQLIQLILILLLVWGLNGGVKGALLANLGAQLAGLLLGMALLFPALRQESGIRFRPPPGYFRDSFRYGLKTHVAGLMNLLNCRIDRLLLNAFYTPALVGVYNVGAANSEKLWLLPQAMTTILLPHLARFKDDDGGRRRLTPIIARNILMALVLSAVVAFGLAPSLTLLLYGQEFLPASRILRLMLPGVVMYALGTVLKSDLNARGRPGIVATVAGIAAVVNIAANLILIPRLGISGAAIASTLSYSLDAALILLVYWRIARVPLGEVLLPGREDLWLWLGFFRGVLARMRGARPGA